MLPSPTLELDPIKTTIFPPDVLTFHVTPKNRDNTLQLARTDIIVRDSASTLMALQREFHELDPKEQRNFVIALIVERL